MEQHLHHDLDLIAAYVEGILEDSSEALRLVDTCPECRREYHLQTSVKGLLAELPQARMTEVERSKLHAVIDRVPTSNVITLNDRRRALRWMRASSVAAAAFVLVGLGAVFLGIMGSGSQSAATTTAATDSLDAAGAESYATTAAATSAAGAQTDQAFRLMAGGDEDAVRDEIAAMLEGSSPEFAEAAQEEAVCSEEFSDREVLDVAQSRLNGRAIVIVIAATEDGKEAIVYDKATCMVVEFPPE